MKSRDTEPGDDEEPIDEDPDDESQLTKTKNQVIKTIKCLIKKGDKGIGIYISCNNCLAIIGINSI